MLFLKITLLAGVLFSSISAKAFLESVQSEGVKSLGRPLFFDDKKSPGKIYIGGGFSLAPYGRINDIRGFGTSESFNKDLYNSEVKNDYPNSPSFDNTATGMNTGKIFLGYAPKRGWLKYTRHELEYGAMGFSDNINMNQLRDGCSGDTCVTRLDYKFKQKYLMYNFYLQTDMSKQFNYFSGFGVGMSYNNINFDATSKAGKVTSDYEVVKNGMAPTYAIFFGFTYDISSAIAFQCKLKATATQSIHKKLRNGSTESIVYTDSKYGPENRFLLTAIAIDMDILFGF